MKDKKQVFIKSLLIAMASTLTVGIASCGDKGQDSSSTTIDVSGEYYFYDEDRTLNSIYLDGSGFTLIIDDETITGSYTVDGSSNLIFSAAEAAELTASLQNGVLTIVYNGITYTCQKGSVYKVTFDTAGGSAIDSVYVLENAKITQPANPTKDGKVFSGWYEDSKFAVPFDFSKKTIEKDTTLYAYFVDPIKEVFTVKFVGSETEIDDRTTNEGGVLTDLPAAVKQGAEFAGWWMSDFYDPEKLTCQYTGQVLAENTTLYAVWKSNAPAVSVTAEGIRWENKGVNVNYRLTITPPEGTGEAFSRSMKETQYSEYGFADKAAGEYKIEVACNDQTTVVYFKNKKLNKVSLFKAEGFSLQFNPVKNAEKYLVTVECGDGDPAHVATHTDYDNGDSLIFNFSNCEMREEGIRFVVKAVAEGYVTSVSDAYVFERRLEQVSGIGVNAETEEFTWNAVAEAEYYMVQIGDGEAQRINGLKSVSVREYAPGDIKIRIYAVAHGYNSSEPAEFTYKKTRLATPAAASITIEGKTLSWDAVSGAQKYTVKIGEKEYTATSNSLLLPDDVDQTNMQVQIRADGATAANNSLYTEAKSFTATLDGQVRYENGAAVWSAIVGCEKYAVKVDDGAAVEVTDGSTRLPLEFSSAGKHVVSVCFYDAAGKQSAWETVEVEVYLVSLSYNKTSYTKPYAEFYRAVGDDLLLPTTGIETPGYTFRYWSAQTDGTQYLESKLTAAAELRLYAQWAANKYTVSFEVGDKASVESPTAEVYYTHDFKLPVATMPAEENKIFVGWFTLPDRQGSQLTDFEGNSLKKYDITKDVTLYPGWAEVLSYKLNDKKTGYSVTKGEGIDLVSSVKVLATYQGLPVEEIAGEAFVYCRNLVAIEIPDSIQLIEVGSAGGNAAGSAFRGCTKLQNVYIYETEITNVEKLYSSRLNGVELGMLLYDNPFNGFELKYYPYGREESDIVVPDGIEVLPTGIFRGSKVTSVIIPASVRAIDANAFASCSLLETVIFASAEVTEEGTIPPLTIGQRAFFECESLQQITLPARVTEIDLTMFASCYNLSDIIVEAGEGAVYKSLSGMLCNAAGDTLLYCPKGKTGSVTIPDGVYTIAEGAFKSCKKIKEVIVPDYVTSIAKDAFKDCAEITSLKFRGTAADAPLSIAESAFYGCSSLTELTLSGNIGSVAAYAFGSTSQLMKVTIESGKVSFADNAFGTDYASSPTFYVKTLVIGANVPVFNVNGAFGPGLNTVTVDPENQNYEAQDNVLYNNGKTQIVYYPGGKTDASFTLPETVTTIGPRVFQSKTYLKKITVGKNVTTVGEAAFQGCTNLTEIEFVAGGTEELTIGANAFYNCYKLAGIVLPERLVSLGDYAFYNCDALTGITLPSTLTSLEFYTDKGDTWLRIFASCENLREIIVAEGNNNYASIDGVLYAKTDGVIDQLIYCPEACAGKDGVVDVPNTVCKIADRAFQRNDGVVEVKFSEGAAEGFEFGINVFEFSATIAKVELPVGMTEIRDKLFYLCETLEEVTIPNTVQKIGRSAFYGCKGLVTLNFAEGNDATPLVLTSNSVGVFENCTSLRAVSLPARMTVVANYAFEGCTSLATVAIPASVTKIGDYAFNKCKITSLTFGAGSELKTIGSYAFTAPYKGVGLTSVSLPEKLEEIGSSAFRFTDLQSLFVPASVKTIGFSAFSDTAIEQLQFAENCVLEKIGTAAFSPCNLTYVKIPKSVKKIENCAFQGNPNLETIEFEEGSQIDFINDYAFRYTGLKSFTFPESRNAQGELIQIELGEQMFMGCMELTTLTLSDSIADLGKSLDDCKTLKTVVVPEGHPYFKNDGTLPLLLGANETLPELKFVFRGLDGDENGVYRIADGTVKIGNNAFLDQINLTKIVIPNSVTEIGDYAFEGCVNLKEIEFEEGISSLTIGEYAFLNCSTLKSINLPACVSELKRAAFEGCTSLKSYSEADKTGIDISHVEILGSSVFDGCSSLTSLTLGDNVTKLDNYAFRNCTSLTTINLSKVQEFGMNVFLNCTALLSADLSAATKFSTSVFEGCTQLNSVTMPGASSTLTTLGNKMFKGCAALTSISLPSSVTFMGTYTFQNSGLTKIKIPDGVTVLGTSKTSCSTTSNVYLFDGCVNLEEVDLNNVTKVGGYVFNNCESLNKVIGSGDLTVWGKYAFAGCTSLRSIDISGATGASAFGYNLFDGCTQLGSVTMPASGLTALASSMFKGCTALKTIELPSSLKFLGTFTFQNSGLESIKIPDGVTQLGSSKTSCSTTSSVYLFDGCVDLKSVDLNNVTKMGAYVFQGCTSLESIDLPDDLTQIGNYTFQNSGLKNITLPKNVNAIGSGVFAGCKNLGYFIVDPANGYFRTDENGYLLDSDYALVCCPASVSGVVELGADFQGIYAYAFLGCDEITELIVSEELLEKTGGISFSLFKGFKGKITVSIPDTVTTINRYAFADSGIESVEIPASVTEIADYAFEKSALKTLTLHKGLKKIGNHAFLDNSALKTVTLPEGLEEIGKSAFANTAIERIVIPASVKFIDSNAFEGCANLVEVIFEPGSQLGGDLGFGTSVFKGCTALKSIALPEGLTVLKNFMFDGCTSLESVTLPSTLVTIGATGDAGKITLNSASTTKLAGAVFQGCTSLKSIAFPASLQEIYGNAMFKNSGITSIDVSAYTIAGTSFFEGCASLTSVTLPDNLEVFENNIFSGCVNLKSIDLPSALRTIGDYAFQNTALTRFVIPESVTTISKGMFEGCAALTELVLHDKVFIILDYAFRGCTGLTSIVIPKIAILGNWGSGGTNAFEGWTAEQTIYIFHSPIIVQGAWGEKWKDGCNATIVWNYAGGGV